MRRYSSDAVSKPSRAASTRANSGKDSGRPNRWATVLQQRLGSWSWGLLALTGFGMIPAATAQELESLRIEGPHEVTENSQTAYTVYALFDTGFEYDVTLFSIYSLEPGEYARVDDFGVLTALEVESDGVEMLTAKFTYGDRTESATQAVAIRDVGLPGFALYFDGAYDRVEVDADLLNTLPLTLEAWVRLDEAWTDHMTVIGNNRPNFWGHGIQVDRNGNLGVMGHDFQEYSSSRLGLGEWHHVCVVFEEGLYRLYLDAREVKFRTYSQRGLDASPFFWIGKNSADVGISREFLGMIDEVRVWHVPREEQDIRCTMHRRLEGNEPGLVAYYSFDEQTGQVVHDATPFGNDGVLGGSEAEEPDADPRWERSEAGIDNSPLDPYWTTPALAPELSTGAEWNCSISADGLTLYIGSERDGFAEGDLYYATRRNVDQPFSAPVLIEELSIPGYENHDLGPFISYSQRRLYFTRHRNPVIGDLYVAERDDPRDPWSDPVPISSLNTSASEYGIAVSADELQAVFASNRSGQYRLYTASRFSPDESWSDVTLINALRDYVSTGPHLSADGLRLYFPADPPGGGNDTQFFLAERVSVDSAFGDPLLLEALSSASAEFSLSLTGDEKRAFLVRKRSNAGDIYESVFVTEDDCGFEDCDAIVKLKARCVSGKLIAKVRTIFAPGTELTLDNEGDRMTIVIDPRGQGKAVWREQKGLHAVYIVGCPQFAEAAYCPK